MAIHNLYFMNRSRMKISIVIIDGLNMVSVFVGLVEFFLVETSTINFLKCDKSVVNFATHPLAPCNPRCCNRHCSRLCHLFASVYLYSIVHML